MRREVLCIAVLMVLAIASGVQAVLVAEYDFDNASATTAYDTAGYYNPAADGTLMVAAAKVYDAERGGNVLSLRNWNDYVACGTFNPSEGTGELTIAGWINWKGFAASPTSCGIVTKRTDFATNMMWGFEINANSKLCFKNNAGIQAVSNQTIAINSWVHIAMTLDSDHNVKYYINGVLDDPGVSNFWMSDGVTAGLNIGTIQNGQNCLNGYIDGLQIYNTALTASEAAALVPEPATVVLLGLGGLVAGFKRRR